MVGDTNLFLSEGGKHAEVSSWHYFSLKKTFLVTDSLRPTGDPDWIQIFDDQIIDKSSQLEKYAKFLTSKTAIKFLL